MTCGAAVICAPSRRQGGGRGTAVVDMVDLGVVRVESKGASNELEYQES
jgi:hypothetical protein